MTMTIEQEQSLTLRFFCADNFQVANDSLLSATKRRQTPFVHSALSPSTHSGGSHR
ncbi:MAG: hypothetical protein RLZZ488_2596 [Pseudomonadota bacterium]